MRHTLAISLVVFYASVAASAAQDCTAEVKALFQGGPWDPFVVGNRRVTTVELHPDGSTTTMSDVLWDGPFRSINCTPNGCFMGIKNASWNGPTFEGPWKKSNDKGIKDFEAFVRKTSERLAASVQKAKCLGKTDLNGKPTTLYQFFSKPEPNEYGSLWGGNYSYWVDNTTNRVVRFELADGIASWAPKPSKDVQVTTVVYDDTIKVTEPK